MFPGRKWELVDTGRAPPPPRLYLSVRPSLPSPLPARGQFCLLREKEEQDTKPGDLAAGLGGQQQPKAGQTCPLPPRTACVGTRGHCSALSLKWPKPGVWQQKAAALPKHAFAACELPSPPRGLGAWLMIFDVSNSVLWLASSLMSAPRADLRSSLCPPSAHLRSWAWLVFSWSACFPLGVGRWWRGWQSQKRWNQRSSWAEWPVWWSTPAWLWGSEIQGWPGKPFLWACFGDFCPGEGDGRWWALPSRWCWLPGSLSSHLGHHLCFPASFC